MFHDYGSIEEERSNNHNAGESFSNLNRDSFVTIPASAALNRRRRTLLRKSKMLQRTESKFGSSSIRGGPVFQNLYNRQKKSNKALLNDLEEVHELEIDVCDEKQQRRTKRSYVYTMLNSNSNQPQATVFKTVMSWIIIVDVIFFIFSTVPEYMDNFGYVFQVEEGIVSWIFLVEYILRLYCVTESRRYGPLGPLRGRLSYIVSYEAIIDALSTFPFFTEQLSGKDLPTLTYLRFFRLMRILRTGPVGMAVDSLNRVLYFNREILYVAGVMAASLIIFTAVAMYYLRPRGVEDDMVWSIPTTLYYSTLMLTGQGGPNGDLPWYTKTVVIFTGLTSIGMFAIPASMLTWGFEAEAERVAARSRKRHLRKLRGLPDDSSSSCSSSQYSSAHDVDDLDTSDEEYMKLIAGGEDGEDSGESDKIITNESSRGALSRSNTESHDELIERIDKLEKKLDLILQIVQRK